MRGLVGTVAGGQRSELGTRFDRMLRRMQRRRSFLTETEQDPAGRWAFGRAHLGNLQPATQGTGRQGGGWVRGDRWNGAEIVRSERLPHQSSSRDVVAHLYAKYGAEFSSRIKGTFTL